ncbi:unnamed protein product [Musa hybrid cultivar]
MRSGSIRFHVFLLIILLFLLHLIWSVLVEKRPSVATGPELLDTAVKPLPELLIGDGAIIANHRVGVIHLRLIFAVILILVAVVFLLASVCGDLLGLDALLEEVKGSSGRLGRVQAGATRLPEVDAGLSLGVLGQALEPARVYPHRREGKIGPGSAAPRGGRRRGSGRG